MITLHDVVQKVRRTFFQHRYAQAARRILNTAPMRAGSMPFTVLSMVHTRDVVSYLVAVKSFASFANPRRVVIVCDPSITEADRGVLKTHIPHVELRLADEFTHDDVPRGGCWERLYAISEYNTSEYVVQLDADTVTARTPTQVINAIRDNAGFVLGEKAGQELMTLADMGTWSRRHHGSYNGIQCVVEGSLDRVGLSGSYYVRGCAGFTGFPRSENMRSNLLAFSKAMKEKHKERWAEWSTEQVTSNYLVSNMPSTKVLPFPEYSTPDAQDHSAVFMHFMGYLRFTTGKYKKATQQAIASLNSISVANTENDAGTLPLGRPPI